MQVGNSFHSGGIRQLGVLKTPDPVSAERLQIPQNIPERRRFLKLPGRSGAHHLLFQLFRHSPDIAVQHLNHLIDALHIFCIRHLTDARAAAVADCSRHTVLAVFLIRRKGLARTQTEPLGQIFAQLAQSGSVRKRSEIKAGILLLETGQANAREPFVPVNLQHRITFVVTQKDIVVWSIFFDETGLQNQCFILVFNGKYLPGVNGIDQRP